MQSISIIPFQSNDTKWLPPKMGVVKRLLMTSPVTEGDSNTIDRDWFILSNCIHTSHLPPLSLSLVTSFMKLGHLLFWIVRHFVRIREKLVELALCVQDSSSHSYYSEAKCVKGYLKRSRQRGVALSCDNPTGSKMAEALLLRMRSRTTSL